MGQKKGLMSFMFKEDENTTETATVVTQQQQQQPNYSTSYQTLSGNVGGGVADDSIWNDLETSLADAHPKGVLDYYDFRTSVREMAAYLPAEDTRYKAAFQTLQKSGITVTSLNQNIDTYASVIQKEKEGFDAAMTQQMADQVTAIQNSADDMQKDNDDMQAKITEMLDKIKTQNDAIAKAKGDAATNESKIQHIIATYTATSDKFIAELNNDKNKITQYLS